MVSIFIGGVWSHDELAGGAARGDRIDCDFHAMKRILAGLVVRFRRCSSGLKIVQLIEQRPD